MTARIEASKDRRGTGWNYLAETTLAHVVRFSSSTSGVNVRALWHCGPMPTRAWWSCQISAFILSVPSLVVRRPNPLAPESCSPGRYLEVRTARDDRSLPTFTSSACSFDATSTSHRSTQSHFLRPRRAHKSGHRLTSNSQTARRPHLCYVLHDAATSTNPARTIRILSSPSLPESVSQSTSYPHRLLHIAGAFHRDELVKMTVCNGTIIDTLSDACVRGFWSAVIPTALIALVLLTIVPPVNSLLSLASKSFGDFLPLQEAEAFAVEEECVEAEQDLKAPRQWPLASVSLMQTLLWVSAGCYSLVDPEDTWSALPDFFIAVTWFYATLRPIVWPTATAPADLLSLFSLHLVFALLIFFGHVYDLHVHDVPLPTPLRFTVYIINLLAVAGLLTLVLNMPLAVPSKRVNKEEIVSCALYALSYCMIRPPRRAKPYLPKTTQPSGVGRPSAGSYLSSRRGPITHSMRKTFGSSVHACKPVHFISSSRVPRGNSLRGCGSPIGSTLSWTLPLRTLASSSTMRRRCSSSASLTRSTARSQIARSARLRLCMLSSRSPVHSPGQRQMCSICGSAVGLAPASGWSSWPRFTTRR